MTSQNINQIMSFSQLKPTNVFYCFESYILIANHSLRYSSESGWWLPFCWYLFCSLCSKHWPLNSLPSTNPHLTTSKPPLQCSQRRPHYKKIAPKPIIIYHIILLISIAVLVTARNYFICIRVHFYIVRLSHKNVRSFMSRMWLAVLCISMPGTMHVFK